MDKPNCYKCKYRESIPGDAHSKCVHPALKPIWDNPISDLISLISKVDITEPLEPARIILSITGDEHGMKMGWFNWPLNFDPAWLKTCDGFESVDAEDQAVNNDVQNEKTAP